MPIDGNADYLGCIIAANVYVTIYCNDKREYLQYSMFHSHKNVGLLDFILCSRNMFVLIREQHRLPMQFLRPKLKAEECQVEFNALESPFHDQHNGINQDHFNINKQ